MKIPIVFILAVLTACGDAASVAPRDSAVQAALIDSLFVRDTIRVIVVGDSTVSGGTHFVDEDYANAIKWLGPLPDGLQADFEAKRGLIRRVDSLALRVPMRRFTAADRAAVQAHRDPTSYWNEFSRRFPASSGLVEISRVGFSRVARRHLCLSSTDAAGFAAAPSTPCSRSRRAAGT